MITEYHIKLILGQLEQIIKNQNEMLDEIRSRLQIVSSPKCVELDPPRAEFMPDENVQPSSSDSNEKRKRTIAKQRQEYEEYYKNGGKLSWNEWRKTRKK